MKLPTPPNHELAPSGPPMDPASRQSERNARAIDQQISRLFGESLFGAWQDSPDLVASPRYRKRGRVSSRLAASIVIIVVLATAAGTWVYRRGAARQAAQERVRAAQEVAAFLMDGELDRLARFLNMLLPPGQPLEATDPYLDLIVSAEAALYRYQDAAPARLARIAPYLVKDGSHPVRFLARLTVASQFERAEAYDLLVNLPAAHAQSPEYHTLMAQVLEARGDAQGARLSWRRSFQVGRLWLPHRYLQCAFEARHRNTAGVTQMVGHMLAVAPDSPWTRMAHQRFASTTSLPAGSSSPVAPSPVARHHAELAMAFQSLAARDLAAARPALGRALAAVNDQAPFVLDVFLALLDVRANDLAMELTSYDAWPHGQPWAQAALARLQTPDDARRQASSPPSAEPDGAVDAKTKPSAKKTAGNKKAKKVAKSPKPRSGRRR